MRILVSAFAFAPFAGSEPGVGWRWTQELLREGHEVVVITDATRRAVAEPEINRLAHPGLEVLFHRPAWLRWMPLNSGTAQLLYLLWQFSLPALARRLHRERPFDLALHLTYGVFRHPSFLGNLGVPFVFGPVGGGEDAPRALKRSIVGGERVREALRAAANRVALVDPLLWSALSRCTLILVKTPQTRAALPWPFRGRAVVFPEIGIDMPAQAPLAQRQPGEPMRALFAGRLVGWKGAHLALMAVAEARQRGVDVRLALVGHGPYLPTLRSLAERLALGDAVEFIGQVPQPRLFELYRAAHVFLFPSLHDSSGNVVLEAQAFGCPVVCLDLGGPPTLVAPESALVVATRGRSESAVVGGLAEALQRLAADEPGRLARATAAHVHAAQQTWASRVRALLELVGKVQSRSRCPDAQGIVDEAARARPARAPAKRS